MLNVFFNKWRLSVARLRGFAKSIWAAQVSKPTSDKADLFLHNSFPLLDFEDSKDMRNMEYKTDDSELLGVLCNIIEVLNIVNETNYDGDGHKAFHCVLTRVQTCIFFRSFFYRNKQFFLWICSKDFLCFLVVTVAVVWGILGIIIEPS